MTANCSTAPRRAGCFLLGGLLLLALFGPGCAKRSTLPKTHPVSGSVKYKGGLPAAKASILFVPLKDASLSVSGEVKDDGSFTLHTVNPLTNEKTSGAPEGEYKVTIQPPIPADQRPVPGVTLAQTYKVEPKDNTFPIEIDAPSKP